MKEKLVKLKERYLALRAAALKKLEKPVAVLKKIFGWGIMISLFAGAMTIFGYIFAFIAGGNLATEVCLALKTYAIPAVTYTSTGMVMFGLLIMYLSGQTALSAKKK